MIEMKSTIDEMLLIDFFYKQFQWQKQKIDIIIWPEYKLKFDLFMKQNNIRNSNNKIKRQFLQQIIKTDFYDNWYKLKTVCETLYLEGYGLKLLARKFDVSYTEIRIIFDNLEIEKRRGLGVVTDKLKEIRSINLKEAYNKREGLFKTFEKKTNKTSRGVQGYYYNQGMNKLVWLRSTYEFIYAKWLDKQKIIWDVEVKTFKLKSTYYRPDFFLYDNIDNFIIEKIVEIKGYWKRDVKKLRELQYENPLNCEVCIIFDIKPYIEENSNYLKELKEWKKSRILSLEK